MLYVKLYLLVFLYFTLINLKVYSISLTDRIVQSITSIQNTKDDYVKKVTFFDSNLSYSILMTGPRPKHNELEILNKVNIFYSAISCSFAESFIVSIQDFVAHFPLFYQYKFLYGDHDKKFMDTSEVFKNLSMMDQRLLVLLNILNKIINNNWNILYYSDTSILKIFISLKIKMHVIISQKTKNKLSESVKSCMVIIRCMLEEMNALQRFMSTNCFTSTTIDNHIPHHKTNFHGYWTINNNLFNFKSNPLLSDIKKLFEYENSLLQLNHCESEHIFLDNFVTNKYTNERISFDIINAKIIMMNIGMISNKVLLEQIRRSYDVDLICWYQRSVIMTILKLIYSKILYIIRDGKDLPQNIKNKIKTLNPIVTVYKNRLPIYLVEGVADLMTIDNKDSFSTPEDYKIMVQKINKMHEMLSNNIELDYSVSYSDNIEDNQQNDVACEYLENILTILSSYFKDFLNFHEYFMSLSYEYDKYYTPYIQGKNIPQSITRFTEDSNESENECNFVLKMYYVCCQAIRFLNQGMIGKNIDSMPFKRAWKVINDIQNNFFNKIKIKNDPELMKTAYNVFIILVNQTEPIDAAHGVYFKQIINFIMTELNEYGLKKCRPPKFNFLLFNNIQFNVFTLNNDHEDIKEVNNFYQDYKSSCFNLKHFYSHYIKKSTLLSTYKDAIRIQWKGEPINIHDIYTESRSTPFVIFSPHHLFAIYDAYFKFIIAMVYYELNYLFTIIQELNNLLLWPKLIELPSQGSFPEYLWPLIKSINDNWTKVLHEEEFIKTSFPENMTAIEKQFNKVNIVFNHLEKHEAMSSENAVLNFNNVIEYIFQEISSNVDYLFKCQTEFIQKGDMKNPFF